MKILNGTETAEIYVEIRDLPHEAFPALVVRDEDSTLVFVDPHATRVEVTAWTLKNLSDDEANALRRAHGEPDRGGCMSETALDGLVKDMVPAILRLPTPDRRSHARRAVDVEIDHLEAMLLSD